MINEHGFTNCVECGESTESETNQLCGKTRCYKTGTSKKPKIDVTDHNKVDEKVMLVVRRCAEQKKMTLKTLKFLFSDFNETEMSRFDNLYHTTISKLLQLLKE